MRDIAAVSARSAWGAAIPILHWDGRSWQARHTALDGVKDATLDSLSALSPTDIWAAGNHLLARYSCP